MRSVISKAILLGLAVATASLAGCSSHGTSPGSSIGSSENAGDVGLQLQVQDLTINTVHYIIDNGTAANHKEGDLNVADAGALLAVIGGVHAGSGYTLSLSATSTSGVGCSGIAGPFTVVAKSTVIVGIELVCGRTSDNGSVKIEGTTNVCPGIDSVSAAVPSGNSIALSLVPSTGTFPHPITYGWTVTQGTGSLSSSTSTSPVYTCSATDSEVHLTATLDEGAGCHDSFALIIDCPPFVDGGTPPPVDSGTPDTGAPDTGTPDTGTADSGTPPIDTGTPPIDTGTPPVDSGTPPLALVCGAGTPNPTRVTAPAPVAGNAACTSCENDNGCPVNNCDQFSADATAFAQCNAVVACVRRTNCAVGAVTDCFCGTSSASDCNAGTAATINGACKTEIVAGLPGIPPSGITTNINNNSLPTGAAINLNFCDQQLCNNGECLPYCN